jgi:hypothetical protein
MIRRRSILICSGSAVANDWLAGGGSEGDLMRLMGWHDRSMVDRYAAPRGTRLAAIRHR